MANSKQLSANNQGGRIRINDDINTESNFSNCVKNSFEQIKIKYPKLELTHIKSIRNTELVNILNEAGVKGEKKLLGGDKGGCSPDGGIFYVKCKDELLLPVFIGENKWQEDNPGNALERAVKNLVFFQHLLIKYDYFPYLINLNGSIVNDSKGTYFDRLTMVGGFMSLDTVYVKSDPTTPRIRPFTFTMSKEFNYNFVNKLILDIVDESISYLYDINKL